MFRALISPVTSLLAALISVATLAIGLRLGQSVQLVGYNAGLSIGSIVSIVVAMGSPLAYITGDVETQQSVRALRLKLVLPLSLALSFGISWGYSSLSGVPFDFVMAGCLAAVCNASSELESAHLQRKLDTVTLLFVETASRLGSLILLLTGVGFAWSLLFGAVTRFVLLYFFSRKDPSRASVANVPISKALPKAVRIGLMGSSFLYVVVDRAPFIVFPLVAGGQLAGYYVALLSGQQSVAGALASGLRTSMASRSEQGVAANNATTWHGRFERLIIGLSLLLSVGGYLLTSFVFSLLSVPIDPDTRLLWVGILLSMPLGTAARALQYGLLSRKRDRATLRSVMAGATVMVGCMVAAVALGSWILVPFIPVVSEAFSLAFAMVSVYRKQ